MLCGVQAMLPRQLVEAVQWEGTIRKMVAAGEQGWHPICSTSSLCCPSFNFLVKLGSGAWGALQL